MRQLKDKVRKEIFERLRNQTKEEKSSKSKKIKQKLFSLKLFKEASVVMFYVSKDDEVETGRMIEEAFKIGKRVAVPHCISETKHIIAAEFKDPKKDLELGPHGIYHPRRGDGFKEVPLEKIDLVIVPGVAFDEKNNRLGRGKGYYDRFLSNLPARTPKIGLCFDFQRVENLPKDSHDLPVSRVITN